MENEENIEKLKRCHGFINHCRSFIKHRRRFNKRRRRFNFWTASRTL